jgi:hypothetical protein
MYLTEKFPGIEGQGLAAHPCRAMAAPEHISIEFWTPGGEPVVLSREQFQQLVTWVERQFEILGKQPRIVH